MRLSLRLVTMLLAVVVVSACTSAVAPASPAPSTVAEAAPTGTLLATNTTVATNTPAITNTPAATNTPPATSTPAATATPTEPARALEDKWYVDSDGNAIPDFVESQLGYNPNIADCMLAACPGAADGTDFLNIERHTLLMLDSSGSMAGVIDGTPKIDAAKSAITRYVNGASLVTDLGLLVYGHKGNNTEAGKPESCVGIDVLTPIGQLQRDTIQSVLDQFQPTGWTPIAAALTKASEVFTATEGVANRIIMVSDGIETCEGDPVAVAKQLHEQDIAVQIDVVGFDIQESDAQTQLRQVAEVTGGSYTEARNAAELDAYVEQQLQALLDTYESLQCEGGNFYQASACNTQLFLDATAYMQEQRDNIDPSSPEWQAYEALFEDVRQHNDQFQKAAQQSGPRLVEIRTKIDELRQQLGEGESGQRP